CIGELASRSRSRMKTKGGLPRAAPCQLSAMQANNKPTPENGTSSGRKNVRGCSLAIRNIPPSVYRLLSDGRQWESQCRLRRELAFLLSSYADSNGSNIKISVLTMSNSLEKSRSVIFELLDDLRTLGFLQDGEKTGYRGTRARTLNVNAILDAAAVDPLVQ